jgi:hypothetical protein
MCVLLGGSIAVATKAADTNEAVINTDGQSKYTSVDINVQYENVRLKTATYALIVIVKMISRSG